MKVKISDIKQKFPFFLICIGLLFMPSTIRTSVLHSEWALINVASWLGIILLTKRYYNGGKVSVSKNGKLGVANPIWIVLLVALFAMESLMLPEFTATSEVKYIYATILPIYILYSVVDDDDIICYTKLFSRLLTVASTIVVICGLMDMFLGVGIGNSIAIFTNAASLIESIQQGRMVSYFGHPLLTTEIMILTFSFNTLVNYCIEKKSIFYTVYYSLISVIGIGMCGGKTGLVLIAIEFALLYVNKKGLKYFIIIAAAVYLAYGYGLLDTVIGRFIAGFESGDITTGRNTALLGIIQGGMLRFNLLIGHSGMNLSERMIAALEYPPLRWAYLFGVWFSVLMCVVLFAIPAIKILKNKNIKIFIVFLILVLDVNSYNGITTQSDQMLLYCVSVFLLLNLSYLYKRERE
ncbi:hypothetical protein D6117_002449 (plasmid) [Lactococcus lactis]|uniref:hypothetical protein n=3 Tax=Lactococcus lactis TaxID=1358 RepID=UPI000F546A81|nr:hypothetical protein [Lactococcus lactis]RQE06692.1 hypothetical protein D6110_07315 [Lactococcus lactis]RQE16754.1 hypothetical protein D6116_11020 [Lactococcus lactis]RQE28102.1 hypothetical protein D6117_11420 [Lactococcus lactis]